MSFRDTSLYTGCELCKMGDTNIGNTGLVKIMLTLMDYFSPADRRTPWVTD
jgi:hypothetical protein